ncbi:hypothetical protein JSY36_01015 [Bacillus sp. H-16]|uniref:hypothetical protein n=1 Tax=Alteribacter salitolerans TaxID=2912333 RepID=UPI00196405C0|nr:hypothetical protein [Alteribacter salitolerans]MBM7094321.1 hypothetical protein [Alteribacter salitolerans]
MSNYLWRAHTSRGYVSLIEKAADQFEDIHLISGGSKKMREDVLNLLLNKQVQNRAHFVRYLHPTDGKTLEGISDGNRMLILGDDPLHPLKVGARTFDLNSCLTSEKNDELSQLMEQLRNQETKVHRSFGEGKAIHVQKEDYYLKGMDFSKADKAAEDVITIMFDGKGHRKPDSISDERFFGGATAYGPVNFIHSITQPLSNRIIIKGRSGSGKSTLMRKVVKHAEDSGLDVRSFPCGLDPDSLDMVVIPELSYAILDGTAPHVINPTREGDHVIDMFERCMDPAVEKEYETELQELSALYTGKMKSGTEGLKVMLKLEHKLDQLCLSRLNERSMMGLVNELNERITTRCE